MRIGVQLIEAPPGQTRLGRLGPPGSISDGEFLRGYARHAEEVGFDSIWLGDHVVMPVEYAGRYPFAPGSGRFPLDRSSFPDPLVSLAWAAAATSHLKLCTGVLVLPARNPLVLAKQAATLDALSGGRLELGVGSGWWREEVEAVAGTAAWKNRAALVEEAVGAMRALWTEEAASYEGDQISFPPVRCDPKPRRPGGVPILIGGAGPAGARRAGRIADGFIPHPPGPAGHALIEPMREAALANARDPDAIELIALMLRPTAAEIDAHSEAGYTHLYVPVNGATLDDARRALDRLAEDLDRLRVDV